MVRLASGREFQASGGFIGIDADGFVCQGKEGEIEGLAHDEDFDFLEQEEPWTEEERQELAREMVRRWEDFGGI